MFNKKFANIGIEATDMSIYDSLMASGQAIYVPMDLLNFITDNPLGLSPDKLTKPVLYLEYTRKWMSKVNIVVSGFLITNVGKNLYEIHILDKIKDEGPLLLCLKQYVYHNGVDATIFMHSRTVMHLDDLFEMAKLDLSGYDFSKIDYTKSSLKSNIISYYDALAIPMELSQVPESLTKLVKGMTVNYINKIPR